MAIAVSFPTGVISTAKAILLVGGLAALGWYMMGARQFYANRVQHATSLAVLLALAVLGASVLWTTATLADAGHAWTKHAKLALIPLIIALVRTRPEARRALQCFLGMQGIVLVLSWLSWFHVPLPFPTQATPGRDFLVFAGHLDQPIMLAIATAVYWHMRAELNWGMLGKSPAAIALVAASLLNVLCIEFGRTGQVVAIALLCQAVFWQIPRRFKGIALLSPVIVAGVILGASPQVQHRMGLVLQETSSYEASGNIESSSGERLNYWHRSLQAIAQAPVLGYGVGSWNMEYNRMEGGKGRLHTYQIRNPHEEFLLWTVEAGMLGLLLICGVFAAGFSDTRRMAGSAQRATVSVLMAMVVSCGINSSLFDAQIGDYLCVALAMCLALGLRSGLNDRLANREGA